MSLYKSGAKKISGLFGNVNGETKKITSLWTNKDGSPVKVFGSGHIKKFLVLGTAGHGWESEDGKNWTQLINLPMTEDILAVARGEDRYVCVGKSGTSYYSLDGKTWIPMTGLSSTSQHIYDVCYANGIYVCVGTSVRNTPAIYYSLDGETWTGTNITYTNIYKVKHLNGKFVAIKSQTTLLWSDDGINWTEGINVKTESISSYVHDITYGNGKYVMFTATYTYYSEDGANWVSTGVTSAVSGGGIIEDSIFNNDNGNFIGVGKKGSFTVSSDGIAWVESLISTYDLLNICYNGHLFVIPSKNGTIYYSESGETADGSIVLSADFTNPYAICYG